LLAGKVLLVVLVLALLLLLLLIPLRERPLAAPFKPSASPPTSSMSSPMSVSARDAMSGIYRPSRFAEEDEFTPRAALAAMPCAITLYLKKKKAL